MEYQGNKIGSFMKVQRDIRVIRDCDGFLSGVNLDIEFELTTNSMDVDAVSRSIERLIYWLDIINDSIVITPDDSDRFAAISMFNGNNIIMAPMRPSDEVLIILLHRKISKMLEDTCIVGDMKIKASDNLIISCYSPGTALETTLTLDEYMKEFDTYHDEYWWERNDGLTFELSVLKGSSPNPVDTYEGYIDPLDEFDQYMEEELNNTAQVIKFNDEKE